MSEGVWTARLRGRRGTQLAIVGIGVVAVVLGKITPRHSVLQKSRRSEQNHHSGTHLPDKAAAQVFVA